MQTTHTGLPSSRLSRCEMHHLCIDIGSDGQPVVHVPDAGCGPCRTCDGRFFGPRVDRALQGDAAILHFDVDMRGLSFDSPLEGLANQGADVFCTDLGLDRNPVRDSLHAREVPNSLFCLRLLELPW